MLGVSLGLSLALLEAYSALYRAWTHRLPTLPTRFHPKAAGETRIVVIGGSSALGEPYRPWVSVGQVLAWKLGEASPGRRFEVEMLARLGASLEDMHHALEGLKDRPDVLLIDVGHNEFVARFEEERDPFVDEEPGAAPLRFLYRLSLRSPFCRVVYATVSRNRLDEGPPLRNRHHLIDPPVCSPSEYAEVRADFARRLEAVVSYAERLGALPIVLIPPSNEGGFEPIRSVVPPSTPAAVRRGLESDFSEAGAAEDRPGVAEGLYRALLERHPGFAEAHFRLARLLQASGRIDEANRHYLLARVLDGLPIRCTSDFEAIFREVAGRHDVVLVDGPALLRRRSPTGVLDDHEIQDAHHPNLDGTVGLSEAILRALHDRGALGVSGSAPTIDPEDCARHFGLDPERWSAVCERTGVHFRRTSGYRYDPAERLAKARAYEEAARALRAGESPEALGLIGRGGRAGRCYLGRGGPEAVDSGMLDRPTRSAVAASRSAPTRSPRTIGEEIWPARRAGTARPHPLVSTPAPDPRPPSPPPPSSARFAPGRPRPGDPLAGPRPAGGRPPRLSPQRRPRHARAAHGLPARGLLRGLLEG